MGRVGRWLPVILLFVLVVAGTSSCANTPPPAPTAGVLSRYDDLTALFTEWRAFQQPKRVNGVPDYSTNAMRDQQRDLSKFVARLAAINTTGWPVWQQVDYHVVRAEMNGLDFDHRVLRPWENNPAFYVTVYGDESDQPLREGPLAAGGVDLWKYTTPVSPEQSATLVTALSIVPGLLQQAQQNLTGNQKDLWLQGIGTVKEQSATLAAFAERLGGEPAALAAAVQQAKAATDTFVQWLEAQAPKKAGPSGIGIVNYDWYLKNVQLAPYTWQEEVALMERELTRATSALTFEELRHASLPPLDPIPTEAAYDKATATALHDYMAFLKDKDILSVRPDMEPGLRAHLPSFSAGPREFFGEVDARDPEVMRTHGFHWFDKGWMANVGHATSPIRKLTPLYNIFNTRTEGFATAFEELMLQAGMFDPHPRSRELVYILVAERAARALGDLYMHSNRFTLEEASQFAADHTPMGWLSLRGRLVRSEQHLYLQQPAYGTSYVIGKVEADKLLTERRRQLGDDFTLRRWMDEFTATGFVPIALIRWELTGLMSDDVKRMLER